MCKLSVFVHGSIVKKCWSSVNIITELHPLSMDLTTRRINKCKHSHRLWTALSSLFWPHPSSSPVTGVFHMDDEEADSGTVSTPTRRDADSQERASIVSTEDGVTAEPPRGHRLAAGRHLDFFNFLSFIHSSPTAVTPMTSGGAIGGSAPLRWMNSYMIPTH